MVLVTARRTEGGALMQCLVAAGTPGLSTVKAQGLDLVRRFAGLRFEGVQVEAVDVLGQGTAVDAAVEHQLQIAVALQCAEIVGAVERVLEMTVAYAIDRYSFGRALIPYQALKHRFADMKMWLEAMAAAADAAAHAVGTGQDDAAELVSAAKSYAGDKAPFILQDCVQIHGGIGVTWDHDLHLFLRRVVQDVLCSESRRPRPRKPNRDARPRSPSRDTEPEVPICRPQAPEIGCGPDTRTRTRRRVRLNRAGAPPRQSYPRRRAHRRQKCGTAPRTCRVRGRPG